MERASPRLHYGAAVAVGKSAAFLIRRCGRGGGSSLPGKLALRLAPGLIAWLGQQLPNGSVLVTGTNGKTTTARILSRFFAAGGQRVVSNRTGANLEGGIAAALLEAASLRGGLRADVGVLEVDERTVPRLVAQLAPRAVVVTNLFRDQLDRAGEPQLIVRLLQAAFQALPAESAVILNADDPLVAELGRGLGARVYYFGLEEGPTEPEEAQTADGHLCARCTRPFTYSRLYYAHLGHYHCPSCGVARPQPHVSARVLDWSPEGTQVEVAFPSGRPQRVVVGLPGLYNTYNALAALAAATALGCSPLAASAVQAEGEAVVEGPGARGAEAAPLLTVGAECAAFGRMEQVRVGERALVLSLVKNPTAAHETLRAFLSRGHVGYLVFALNDLSADGEDVSWIWDVHFQELVQHPELQGVIATGRRAEDLAVRLKYEGLAPDRLRVIPDLRRALEAALRWVPPGEVVPVLATYTAMLALRGLLERQHLVRPFWEW